MPFLVPLIPTVLGAAGLGGAASWLAGSTILAGVARFGLGLAAKYALGTLLAPKPQAQSVQIETTYGEDLSRTVALGYVGTAGQHIYRNAWGSGNRTVQDVYVLSHFLISEATRVRAEGEWRSFGDPDADQPAMGPRVEGTKGRIYAKTYLGDMDQAADPFLISQANPAGRWTEDHRGTGLAYAIVTSVLNAEKMTQPLEPFFEVKGAPLYDWRKDSSIGGDGTHRWADQSTWEFSENPVLMMYALERGFFRGTEMMVGKGVPASRLPLAEWTIAANICDEGIGDGVRYSAGIIAAAGSGITHDQNMQPLLEACAATWVEDASGEYPIVGAAQSTVLTFTDDDIMVDESFRFSKYRTKSELINTLAGTFIDPEKYYEQTPLTVRIDDAALAEDGERLATSIPYGAVNKTEVADRLIDIAFKASRFQGNADVCIHPKFLADAKPGRWVEWDSDEHGTRTFQILEKRLGPLGVNACRNVYLTLQEVGDGIFDGTEYVTVPTVPVLPGEPDYANTAANFRAAGVQIKDAGTQERKPGLRFTWDAFDDTTVTAVEVEYRPVAALVTVSIASPGVVTWLAHGLTVNDPVIFITSGTLPTGLIPDTTYFVAEVLNSSSFTLAATAGGSVIDTTGTQSGIHHAYSNSIVNHADVPLQVLTVSDGVLAETEFDYRHRIRTNPPRTTFWTDWDSITTPEGVVTDVSVGLAQIQDDLRSFFTGISGDLQEFRDRLGVLAAASVDAAGRVAKDNSVAVRFRNATAAAQQVLDASITDINGELVALASATTAVEASVGLLSADGLFQLIVTAGSGDVTSRLLAQVRATTGDDWVDAGYVMEAGFTGGNPLAPFSRFIVKADTFIVTDGTDEGTPLTFEDGVLKLQVANIGTVIAGSLTGPTGSMLIDLNGEFISIAVP